jgi:RimJ/RimL family protein N-acetyltransferase
MQIIEATDAHFEALLLGQTVQGYAVPPGGIDTPDILTMLRELAASIRPQFETAAWLMVQNDEVVGLASALQVPSESGTLAIGYGVAPTRRKRGYATAAISEILIWAKAEHGVNAVSAETSVSNVPSQRVLEANGFARIGERFDEEDGALLCWLASTS